MNVSSLSSVQSFQSGGVSGSRPQNQLSDEQKDLVFSVLEGYDSGSLSQEDALEIAASFQEAGIIPSRDLANTIADLGFSAQEIGELTGLSRASGTPPPPPSGPPPPRNTQEEENTISSLLETLLNIGSNNQNNTISDKDEEFITALSQASSFESISDYTSRIMSLTEDVKEQVKALFDSYKPENTKLNAEEASKVVVNSLSQILADSNNYKSTSYYA